MIINDVNPTAFKKLYSVWRICCYGSECSLYVYKNISLTIYGSLIQVNVAREGKGMVVQESSRSSGKRNIHRDIRWSH